MILIIPRVSASCTYDDIKRFINPGLKTGVWPFEKVHKPNNIKIIIYKDTRTETVEYHALIYITNEKIAEKVIKKCNRKILNNKHVAVREYQVRSIKNDRRVYPLSKIDDIKGKRKGDRRRGKYLEEITNASIITDTIISGYENFARKF